MKPFIQTAIQSKNFLKNKISLRFLAIVFLFCLGCSPGHTEEKGNDSQVTNTDESDKQFGGINKIEDLLALEYGATSKQIKMINSDDPEFDLEDRIEKKSGKSKILIVGDSWALFPCIMESLDKALKQENAQIINDSRCLRTSKGGAVASEWLNLKQHTKAIEFIKNNPRIKYIYLTLGGNDIMRQWNSSFTPKMEIQLFDKVFKDIHEVMKAYVNVRPDIQVILSGYDYPNFEAKTPIDIYKKMHEKMGRPDPKRMNQALIDFSQYMAQIADNKNLFYIHHLGLSQYHDGVSELNYPARATIPPIEISPFRDPTVVGGNPILPTGRKSFINWLGLARDSFHLDKSMYVEVMRHTYQNVLLNIIP